MGVASALLPMLQRMVLYSCTYRRHCMDSVEFKTKRAQGVGREVMAKKIENCPEGKKLGVGLIKCLH